MSGPNENTGGHRAVHLVAFGRVQGVGFRSFVERAAAVHGALGFVRNRFDGAVEIWAEGSAEQLERLAEAVRRGPGHALVERVDRADVEPSGSFTGFEVRL